jgi:hypothetical protein
MIAPALNQAWIKAPRFGAVARMAPLAGLALVGALIPSKPFLAFLLLALLALGFVAALVPTRFVVAAVLVYLPFQDLVISHVPGSLVLPARYLPELVIYAIALPLLLTRGAALAGREVRVLVAVATIGVIWSLAAVWNGVGIETIAAGIRSEFRFVPLAVIAMLSNRVLKDARFYARVIVLVAVIQAAIALAEAVGGRAVRAIFVPSYKLVVEGVVVGKAETPLDSVFGTFSHRNLLAAFLAFAAIVLVAAGAERLGVSRRTAIVAWLLLTAGTLASVSREGTIALLVGTALVLALRQRVRAVTILVSSGIVAVLALLLVNPAGEGSAAYGVSSWNRWNDVISSRGWSATPAANFRLYYLLGSARTVAHDSPFVGFGLGTVSDPRIIQSGGSPLERFPAGRLSAKTGYYTDGNWASLLLETGFVGVALLAWLFAFLALLGLRVARNRIWVGAALSGLVLATVILGWFAPVLQTRSTNMILWLFAGLAGAVQGTGVARTSEIEGGSDH